MQIKHSKETKRFLNSKWAGYLVKNTRSFKPGITYKLEMDKGKPFYLIIK